MKPFYPVAFAATVALGADPATTDDSGATPLDISVEARSLDSAKRIIGAEGTDVSGALLNAASREP